jgi:hypothetical protein
MESLRAEFETLGFTEVSTFIASGNVIFEAPGKAAPLELRVEAHLAEQLGYPRTHLRAYRTGRRQGRRARRRLGSPGPAGASTAGRPRQATCGGYLLARAVEDWYVRRRSGGRR